MLAAMHASTPLAENDGDALAGLRARLAGHRLYEVLRSAADLRRFTEHHVVCVLDFMSLLKSLQRELSCVEVPWTPGPDPDAARLIGAIVLDEESDVRADGRVMSHFAWYLEAMEEISADTGPARALLASLAATRSWEAALAGSGLPPAARAFSAVTAAALGAPLHVRAAVFFHGREELIPRLFVPIVERLARQGLPCAALLGYLQRHIEIDGGEHGPAAQRLLERLYAGDAARRGEARAAARTALLARLALWDAIAAGMDASASAGLSAAGAAG